MTTLIVGCGYLGRRVARLLLDRGDRVIGTTRSSSSAEELKALGVEPAFLDVLDPAGFATLPQADRLLHCVARDKTRPDSMRRVYVEGLSNLLSSGLAEGGRLVYASSTSVYSQTDGSWVDETSPTEPTSESGRVCLEAEATLRRLAAERSLASTTLRFSGLYGPGRIIGRDAVRYGRPIDGDPSRFLNLIHIDDAARAVVSVFDLPAPGPLYLASDSLPIPRSIWYSLVARHDGSPPPRFHPQPSGLSEPHRQVSNRLLLCSSGMTLIYPTIHEFWAAASKLPLV